MNQQPLISIITVCYNSKKTIERTFKSLLNQTYRNFEYIVVDGKSTDGTTNIIIKYEDLFRRKKISFKWISEEDGGIYNAMNKGIEMGCGELIGIINSDDHYEDSTLEIVAKEYLKDTSFDVYHGLLKYYNSGKLSMIRGTDSSTLSCHMIEHPACFIKAKTYDDNGRYNEKYKYVADYELLCRIQRNGGRFKLIESVLASFYDGGIGNCIESVIEALKLRYEYGFINKKMYIISYIKIKVGLWSKKLTT